MSEDVFIDMIEDDDEYRPCDCPLDPGSIETRQHWQIVQELTKERDEAREELNKLKEFIHCLP